MKSTNYLMLMLVIFLGLCVVSCSGAKKEAASNAIEKAEGEYNYAKPQLMKFVPDQAKAFEDQLNAAKASLEKHDYKTALPAAQALPAKVKELVAAAAAKKAELTKTWDERTSDIPKLLQVVRARLTILSIPQEVPANMDKAKLKAARDGYADASAKWEEAKNDFTGSNLNDAIAKADTVRTKALEAIKLLGLKVPATPAPLAAPAAPAKS